MKITEIKELIDQFVGFDVKDKGGQREYSDLRRFIIYFCYKYSSEFLISEDVAKIVGLNRSMVSTALNGIEDLIKYDEKASKNFKAIEDFLKPISTERKKNNEPLNVDLIKEANQYRKSKPLFDKYQMFYFNNNAYAKRRLKKQSKKQHDNE